MLEDKKISFSENTEFVKAAETYFYLNKPFVLSSLKIFSLLGFSSFGIILLGNLQAFLPKFLRFDFLNSFTLILLKISIFFGLIAFAILIFIKNYFRKLEEKNQISKNALDFEFYKICDLETARIVGVLEKNPNVLEILKRLLDSKRVAFILSELNAGPDFLGKMLEGIPKDALSYNLLLKVLETALGNVLEEDAEQITAGDLFYGFLKLSDTLSNLLLTLELDEEDLKNIIFWENNLFRQINHPKSLTESLKVKTSGIAQNWVSGYTLNLNRFGFDITGPNLFNGFSVFGREELILEIENILSKSSKNNCILTGEVGVGKATLAYGIAERIYWGKTLPSLAYKRVVSLDIGSMLSGAINQEEVEARFLSILGDAAAAGNIILFIDNIHTLFSGGKVGTIDASEALIPYLQNPNLQIICTTTNRNFQTYIEPKTALVNCFEKIEVPPTDKQQTIRILEDLSLYYSNRFKLRITYSALKEVYRLADNFITNKEFPEKAIDILDSACSSANSSNIGILDSRALDSVEEKILNIPVKEAEEDEKEKLLHLEERIHERIIGKNEAVKAVADALRRARTKSKDDKRPIGSFLFLGPTGVGKTELAKALAEVYFGDEACMVRMDMNEYQDAGAQDRFIGKKLPGTFELEAGDLVKGVRERPFSVILLDELEKAHPNILNLFLQILDEGYITDGMGEKVIFSNCIIIATSNAGANFIRENIRKGTDIKILSKELLNYLLKENIYKPEFLNRFDGVIVFPPLTQEEILRIAKLMFKAIKEEYKKRGYVIELAPEVLEKLSQMGFESELGARPMKRVFQDVLENFLATKILEGKIEKGETFTVNLDDLKERIS